MQQEKYPNSIPLVFSSNDYFVPYMAVMMQSVMENERRGKKYCFFVLYREISKNNMDLLRRQIVPFPCFSIEFVDITQYIKEHDFFVGTHHRGITIETFFRLLVCEIFSSLGYNKVIYLDGDMICLTDISELYDIDIASCCLGASRDIMGIGCYYSGKYKYLKGKNKEYTDGKILIKNLDNYFNAGMIVFNVKQFQKTYSFGQIMNFATSKKWRAHDQDILNVLVENNMLLLPMKWNYTEERNIEFYAPDYIKKEYFDAKGDPKIIHYCKNKPWKIFFYGANFHYFWIFASKTPFFETIISRMKQDGLISSTSYDENMLRDAGNGEGPGLKCLIKSIFIRFGASKSRFFSGF